MSTSSISRFKYQPEKIMTETVYCYIKSNLDGSNPARVFIRVMDRDNLDVWKFEAHNYDAAHVTAHMDWESFSADRIQSSVVTSDGKSEDQALLTASSADAACSVRFGGQSETINIGHFPVHVYNFDFISLNFSLRHWSEPYGDVEIGIIQPNFDPNREGFIKYEGNVLLQYLGEETRNSMPCLKYSIGGEGLQGQRGFIWVDRDLMHAVDIEIPIPDNPDWNSFKFNLISVQQMNKEAWQQFMNAEIQKLAPVE